MKQVRVLQLRESMASNTLNIESMAIESMAGNRDSAVVRALASHQCGPGSIPGPGDICRLSLCWFSTLLRGFFSGYSGFPPSAKTDTQRIRAGCWLCCKVMRGAYSRCQRRLYMLSVRPCRAASLLYLRGRLARQLLPRMEC